MSLLAMMRRRILAKRDRICDELVLLASFRGLQEHKAFPSGRGAATRAKSKGAKPQNADKPSVQPEDPQPYFDGCGREHDKFDLANERAIRECFTRWNAAGRGWRPRHAMSRHERPRLGIERGFPVSWTCGDPAGVRRYRPFCRRLYATAFRFSFPG
jgi:hypothetical protein